MDEKHCEDAPPPPPPQAQAQPPPPPPAHQQQQQQQQQDGKEAVHVSGFPVELFVGDEVKDFLCAICTDVCRDAVETACGHIFCDWCLSVAVEIKNVCPLDQKPLVSGSVHKAGFVRRKVQSLQVRCPNHACGCPHECALGDLDAHKCAHRPAVCGQCAARVPAAALEQHARRECPCRLVECPDCSASVEWEDLRPHAQRLCPRRRQACGLCDSHDLLEPPALEAHRKGVCPAQEVRCRYALHGCSQPIRRADVARHTAEAAQYHLDLVEQHFAREMALMRGRQARLGRFYMTYRHEDEFLAAVEVSLERPATARFIADAVLGLEVFAADPRVVERACAALALQCAYDADTGVPRPADGATATPAAAAGAAAQEEAAGLPSRSTLVCRAGGVREAIAVMRTYAASPQVVEAAVRLLRKMATNADVKAEVHTGKAGCITAIVEAMDRHAGNLQLQRDALGVLLNMAVNDAIEERIGDVGGVGRVVAAMDRFKDNQNIQQLASHCLFHLTFNSKNRERLVDAGVIPRLIFALRRHCDHESTSYYAIRALAQLGKVARNRSKMRRHGLVQLTEAAIARHPTHKDMTRKARALLGRLRERPAGDRARPVVQSGTAKNLAAAVVQ